MTKYFRIMAGIYKAKLSDESQGQLRAKAQALIDIHMNIEGNIHNLGCPYQKINGTPLSIYKNLVHFGCVFWVTLGIKKIKLIHWTIKCIMIGYSTYHLGDLYRRNNPLRHSWTAIISDGMFGMGKPGQLLSWKCIQLILWTSWVYGSISHRWGWPTNPKPVTFNTKWSNYKYLSFKICIVPWIRAEEKGLRIAPWGLQVFPKLKYPK